MSDALRSPIDGTEQRLDLILFELRGLRADVSALRRLIDPSKPQTVGPGSKTVDLVEGRKVTKTKPNLPTEVNPKLIVNLDGSPVKKPAPRSFAARNPGRV
jgi:hypothetical protein